MTDRLHAQGDQVLELLDSILEQSSLEDANRPDDSLVVLGASFGWNDLDEAGRRLQSRLLNLLADYTPRIEFMVRVAPAGDVKSVEQATNELRELADRSHLSWHRTVDEARAADLKTTKRADDVRQTAEAVSRRIKDVRGRGNARDGVVLRTGRSTLRLVAAEADYSSMPGRLDPEIDDDRLVAETLELMRRHPRTPVTVVTNDINLQTKCDAADGRDLGRRNPFIYTVRGVEEVDDWADRVLADKETSAIEGHIGTFLEEVARIVSGGIKPGNGVDLQLQDEEGGVHLFAIQAATNTKNSGARRSDVESLKRAARPLRAHRQRVSLNIAILAGQEKTRTLRSDSAIIVLASDDFWHRISGIPDFRARLLRASTILAWLIKARSRDEVERIKGEAREVYGNDDGRINLDALASVGRQPSRAAIESDLLDT